MIISKLLKIIIAFIILLLPVDLSAQDSLGLNNKLAINAEKLELIFETKTKSIFGQSLKLFNPDKSKVNVGNYGVANIKKSNPSSSKTEIFGISYDETRFTFSIDFVNSLNQTSKLKGSEKNSNVLKKIKADITTNSENSNPWSFFLQEIGIKDVLSVEQGGGEIGKLTNGNRTIIVRHSDLDHLEYINMNNEIPIGIYFYEFIENGISLGTVAFEDANSIWLNPDLDSTTKLVLCTAMLAIGN